MKKISELTEEEANQILEFKNPDKTYYGIEIISEPRKTENGIQVSMSGNATGIEYKINEDCNTDTYLIPFDNPKVALWLYRNGYDISDFIEKLSCTLEKDDLMISEIWDMFSDEMFKANPYTDTFDDVYINIKSKIQDIVDSKLKEDLKWFYVNQSEKWQSYLQRVLDKAKGGTKFYVSREPRGQYDLHEWKFITNGKPDRDLSSNLMTRRPITKSGKFKKIDSTEFNDYFEYVLI